MPLMPLENIGGRKFGTLRGWANLQIILPGSSLYSYRSSHRLAF